MELTHAFTVPSSVEDTWTHFMDLEAVGGCFPGATVTDVSGDEFSGTVKVKLGPIALLYAGTGRFIERDHTAYRAVLEAKGKDRRGNGTAAATVTIALAPDGTGTRAEVVTDLAVTGKPAQFGRGVMQDVTDKLLGAFLDCLEVQLSGAPAVERIEDDGAPVDVEVAEPSKAAAPAQPVDPGPASRVGMGTATRAPSRAANGSRPPVAELDLGSAVLPVLAKTYGPYLLAALAGVLIGMSLRRRR